MNYTPDGCTVNTKTFRISLINAKAPARLSKAFKLTDGALVKLPGGQLARGTVTKKELSVSEFVELLGLIEPSQALTYGVSQHEQADIVAKANLESAKAGEFPCIARTREYFSWPDGFGILMLDYDPPKDGPSLKSAELLAALYAVWPDLKTHVHIWAVSASSCIYDSATNTELRGIMGQRVYIPVQDARDIPRAGNALYERLWLDGHGRFDVSKSGTLLDRNLVDASVWQPERLDFAGGAQCGVGIVQRKPTPITYQGDADFIDTALTLPALSPDEQRQLDQLKDEARRLMQPASHARQHEWVEERIEEAAKKLPAGQVTEETRNAIRETYNRAVTEKRLFGDFVLHTEKGEITVAQILDNPDKYHGLKCADPLEPGYGNDPRIAWMNLRAAGRPYVRSHAHGGCRFTLHRALKTIRTAAGTLRETCLKLLELMRLDGAIFDRGGELVRMAEGGLHSVAQNWLAAYASTVALFEKFEKKQKKWVPIDCPPVVARVIMESDGEWNLPKLTGIITAPTMTPAGCVIDTDGYDADTGLYLDFPNPDGWAGVPDDPTDQDCEAAVHRLWLPFQDFPFTDAVAIGGFLAAIFTAVVRPLLPTAPGFGLFAPTAGSGKTLLAQCLAALAGQDARVIPRAEAEEEMRKRLFAAARGGARCIVLDNLSGTVESESLCAFLTSPFFADRVLGASSMVSVPSNSLCLLTGNGPAIVGDLNRRLIRVMIDPQCERPHERRFDFDPLRHVREHRLEMVHDALTILRTALQRAEKPATGFGSFEEWSGFIRRAVLFVGAQGWLDVADPAQSVAEAFAADPDTQKLGALLAAWGRVFGDQGATVAEAIKRCKRGDDDDLFDALNEIGGERDLLNPRRIGRWIEGRANRIVAATRFVRHDTKRHHAVVWIAQKGSLGSLGSFPHTYMEKCQEDTRMTYFIGCAPKTPQTPQTPPLLFDEGLDDEPTLN